MPHVFHTNDFIKMMSASRKASIVLRYVKLPANYPILMYNASAGGAHRWLGGMRPPPPGLMRVSDHLAASALRATANWSSVPLALFLQPLETGWTGIQPTTVVMLLQFLLNYIKQVSHTNPVVRYSVLRSLWRARQSFSEHMSCVQTPLSSICLVHYTDHSRFLPLMHSMGTETHFPASIMEQDDDTPMYKANHSMEANQIHAWMSEGHQTQRKAKQMGWPIPMSQSELPRKSIPIAYPLATQLLVITHIPQEPLFMVDGSWYPDGHRGGCIAIVCTHTYQCTLYPVVITISLDHSYAVELYVAWILLCIRTNLQSTDHGQWCFRGQTYTNSMSYIQALQAQNDATTDVVKRLLQACRHMVKSFASPKHIHSHRRGTVLDRILDAVDQEAKNTALKQQRHIGWIIDLDAEQVVFTVTGTQKHDLSKYIERKLREMYCTQHGVSCAHNHTRYALYANIVMMGEFLWSVHLHTVTQRHHMQHLTDTKCTICKLPITRTHAPADCPLLFLRTWYLYVKLSHLLRALNPTWNTCLPTPWGTLVVTPMGYLVFTVHPVGYLRIPHDLCTVSLIGEVSSQSMHHAKKHGATHTMMIRVLGSLLTTWHKVQHVEGPPLLPVHQEYAVPCNP